MDSKTPSVGLIELLNSRRHVAERFGKKFLADVKKWEKDYAIETYDGVKFENLRNVLQIPYIFSTVEGNLPTMFERMPQIIMKQRGREDREFTDFAEKIWDYLTDRLCIEEKVENAGMDFLISGLSVAKYGWERETETVDDPKEEPILNEDGTPVVDEAGQPVTQEIIDKVQVVVKDLPYLKIVSLKNVLFSPESLMVVDDEENIIPYVICKRTMEPEAIKDYWGKDVSDEAQTMDMGKDNDGKEIFNPDETPDAFLKDDIKRVTVYEYYGILPKAVSKDKNWSYDKVYYTVFTAKTVIEKPQPIDKKPFVLTSNYGTPTRFFPWGEPRTIRELEQDVSLGRSRISDLRDKQGTKIAIPGNVDFNEDSLKNPVDYTIMRMTGGQKEFPQYITPPALPDSILVALGQSRQDIQMTTAMLDSARGAQTSNEVDTATGQKIYFQAMQGRMNRKRKKLGRFIKAIAKNLLMLCAANWDMDMFARITDMAPEEIEQAGFVEKLKSLGEDYDVEIDIDEITANKETISAQAIALYRETKDDPLVNRAEILKNALKVGFGLTDFDKFLSGTITPDQMGQAIQFLVENGLMDPAAGEQAMMALQQVQAGSGAAQGQVGRPAIADPTEIVKKSMAPSDGNQMTAQTAAAGKQMGVPKGPQMPSTTGGR